MRLVERHATLKKRLGNRGEAPMPGHYRSLQSRSQRKTPARMKSGDDFLKRFWFE